VKNLLHLWNNGVKNLIMNKTPFNIPEEHFSQFDDIIQEYLIVAEKAIEAVKDVDIEHRVDYLNYHLYDDFTEHNYFNQFISYEQFKKKKELDRVIQEEENERFSRCFQEVLNESNEPPSDPNIIVRENVGDYMMKKEIRYLLNPIKFKTIKIKP
jgi:hypothetical protein